MPTYEIEGVKYTVNRKFETNTTKTFIEYLFDYFKLEKEVENLEKGEEMHANES